MNWFSEEIQALYCRTNVLLADCSDLATSSELIYETAFNQYSTTVALPRDTTTLSLDLENMYAFQKRIPQ